MLWRFVRRLLGSQGREIFVNEAVDDIDIKVRRLVLVALALQWRGGGNGN